MTSIVIKTKNTLSENDITVLVNRNNVEFTVDSNNININCRLEYGLHTLELCTVNPVTVDIETVLIDNCNIREFVYLGYINDNGRNWQPATTMWGKAGITWTLHFITPLSRWIDVNSKKFLRSEVATDLSEKYHVMYPESVAINNDNIPQAVKDFYSANFDYTVINKQDFNLRDVPYMRYTREIPQELLNEVAQEFRSNYEYLKEVSGIKTSIDSAGFTKKQEWKLHWLISPPGKVNSDMDKFPVVQKLVDFLGIEVFYLFIGILPPGGFIYPHCDNYEHNITGHERFDGCTQLYIPVIWPEGCSIKMANAGLVPLDRGTMLINADYVAHAGVNVGTENRFVIGLRTTQEEVLKNSEFV